MLVASGRIFLIGRLLYEAREGLADVALAWATVPGTMTQQPAGRPGRALGRCQTADVTSVVAREQLRGANAMQLHVNPHELILVGENSFLRLSTDGSQTASTRCSHWRVLWSPAGAGHALFVESGVVGGVRVYSA